MNPKWFFDSPYKLERCVQYHQHLTRRIHNQAMYQQIFDGSRRNSVCMCTRVQLIETITKWETTPPAAAPAAAPPTTTKTKNHEVVKKIRFGSTSCVLNRHTMVSGEWSIKYAYAAIFTAFKMRIRALSNSRFTTHALAATRRTSIAILLTRNNKKQAHMNLNQ